MLFLNLLRQTKVGTPLTWRKCSELKQCSQFLFQTLTRSYCDTGITPPAVCQLKSRGLIQVKGSDAVPFLQGLVTNDVTLLQQQTRALYAMLLNVQGRVQYDMMLYNITKSDDAPTILLECDQTLLQDLIKDIRKYKIRKKVSTDPVQELSVVAAMGQRGNIPELDNEIIIQTNDPRVPKFGSRIIVSGDIKGKDETVYHESRVKWGIPEGPVDLPPGNCLPLECNIVYMNGVSFTKGCYLGQELTARTHHTGVIRKRVMPLVFTQDPSEIDQGENIVNEQNKNVGKFRNSVGKFGLGLMRMADLKGKLSVKTKTGKSVDLTAIIPDWWPKE